MEIIVRKPTAQEEAQMKSCPVWGCEASTFDWHYSDTETCLLIEGDVTVTYDGGQATFGAGDYVILPKGMDCVWHVKSAVKKHYKFG